MSGTVNICILSVSDELMMKFRLRCFFAWLEPGLQWMSQRGIGPERMTKQIESQIPKMGISESE